MAKRIWSYHWDDEVRRKGWQEFTVTTTETMNRDALDWCLSDEQAGWFSTKVDGSMTGVVGQPKYWSFTDPNVAFFFKVIFCNGVPKT